MLLFLDKANLQLKFALGVDKGDFITRGRFLYLWTKYSKTHYIVGISSNPFGVPNVFTVEKDGRITGISVPGLKNIASRVENSEIF